MPTIKSLVYAAMPDAYAQASDDHRLPAPARQIGYALRQLTGLGDELKLDYLLKGKQQGLINAYLEDHPEETKDWDVLRDARGSVVEPHTGTKVPLGTREVRDHLRYRSRRASDEDNVEVPTLPLGWATSGPEFRFGAVLYIEKEGFSEQLTADQIGERWDLAVLSSKGYSVRAARKLLVTWAKQHPEIKILVAHDFDKQGIGIFGLIHAEVPHAVDLGLRLDDIDDPRWDLAAKAESVTYGKTNPLRNLTERGARPDEAAFLCDPEPNTQGIFTGKRVELNALVGRKFIDWLEAKLAEAGVEKVIPDKELLEAAFRRAYRQDHLNEAIADASEEATEAAEEASVPDDLAAQVADVFQNGNRGLAWDDVIAGLARRAREES